ncbi:MAG: hypothetical protein JSR97_12355 [Verrucomicrobia bacterium]|nr:hypothetical protein [Verrucomicrobiota bacterium]
MQKYKTVLSAVHCAGLRNLISYVCRNEDFKDKPIFLAAIMEVMLVLNKKEIEYKREYKITFSAVQAIAVSKLYAEYISPHADFTNDFTSRMLMIHNEITQKIAN